MSAVQTEYSLFTRDPEGELLATLRELGVGFVAYSPLGRGMLTGAIASRQDLAAGDVRRHAPRFSDENFSVNRAVVEQVRALAESKGVTPAQLALAWTLAQGHDVVPIPGTKRRRHLEENVAALDVALTPEELACIEGVAPPGVAAGRRYPETQMARVNV
jgi:aryl-alcohol dehydrogenase-like predicted oxidoreductase